MNPVRNLIYTTLLYSTVSNGVNSLRNELYELVGSLKGYLKAQKEIGIENVFMKSTVKSKCLKSICLEELHKKAAICTKCPLHKGRTQVVFGEGNPEAQLVFVGEAPGAEEDIQGKPFVGAAGQLLTKIIEAMGMKRSDVYICNIIKCRPSQNRQPLLEEISACKPYIVAQLDIIQPKIVCALGRYAVLALLGKDEPISKIRGNFYECKGINPALACKGGVKVMPTFHPAYLLRNPSAKRLVWADMKKVICSLR